MAKQLPFFEEIVLSAAGQIAKLNAIRSVKAWVVRYYPDNPIRARAIQSLNELEAVWQQEAAELVDCVVRRVRPPQEQEGE